MRTWRRPIALWTLCGGVAAFHAYVISYAVAAAALQPEGFSFWEGLPAHLGYEISMGLNSAPFVVLIGAMGMIRNTPLGMRETSFGGALAALATAAAYAMLGGIGFAMGAKRIELVYVLALAFPTLTFAIVHVRAGFGITSVHPHLALMGAITVGRFVWNWSPQIGGWYLPPMEALRITLSWWPHDVLAPVLAGLAGGAAFAGIAHRKV